MVFGLRGAWDTPIHDPRIGLRPRAVIMSSRAFIYKLSTICHINHCIPGTPLNGGDESARCWLSAMMHRLLRWWKEFNEGMEHNRKFRQNLKPRLCHQKCPQATFIHTVHTWLIGGHLDDKQPTITGYLIHAEHHTWLEDNLDGLGRSRQTTTGKTPPGKVSHHNNTPMAHSSMIQRSLSARHQVSGCNPFSHISWKRHQSRALQYPGTP